MNWIALSYSMPTQASSQRVTLWRRLRRLGAVSPAGGLYFLPAQDDCLESLQWLAQEIRHAGGDALLLHVLRLEGLTDGELIAHFNEARAADYEGLAAELAELEQQLGQGSGPEEPPAAGAALQRLQKQQGEIMAIDYFHSPAGLAVSERLERLARRLLGEEPVDLGFGPLNPADYRGRRWVTRPRPHVDRLACGWLIRRFIDEGAVIRYAVEPAEGEIPFDYDRPAGTFTHAGPLCTFEVMIRAFELGDPALAILADIVHEIDLRDGRSSRPETAGVEAALRGWLRAGFSDAELEAHGLALFDGLFATLQAGERPGDDFG